MAGEIIYFTPSVFRSSLKFYDVFTELNIQIQDSKTDFIVSIFQKNGNNLDVLCIICSVNSRLIDLMGPSLAFKMNSCISEQCLAAQHELEMTDPGGCCYLVMLICNERIHLFLFFFFGSSFIVNASNLK